MNRTKFYKKTVVNNIQEVDLLYHNLSEFKMKYDPDYYRTDTTDAMRPDLISYRNYGTIRYWWIICLVNSIQNPFNDITVGMILKIPNILDIYDFYKSYKMR